MRISFPVLSYTTNWPTFTHLASSSSPTIVSIGCTDGFIYPSSTNISTNHTTNGSVRLDFSTLLSYTHHIYPRSSNTIFITCIPPFGWFLAIATLSRLRLRLPSPSLRLPGSICPSQHLEHICEHLTFDNTHTSRFWFVMLDPWFRYGHWPFPREVHQWAGSSYATPSILHCKLWSSKSSLFFWIFHCSDSIP